jgi:hypothetical protein
LGGIPGSFREKLTLPLARSQPREFRDAGRRQRRYGAAQCLRVPSTSGIYFEFIAAYVPALPETISTFPSVGNLRVPPARTARHPTLAAALSFSLGGEEVPVFSEDRKTARVTDTPERSATRARERVD